MQRSNKVRNTTVTFNCQQLVIVVYFIQIKTKVTEDRNEPSILDFKP